MVALSPNPYLVPSPAPVAPTPSVVAPSLVPPHRRSSLRWFRSLSLTPFPYLVAFEMNPKHPLTPNPGLERGRRGGGGVPARWRRLSRGNEVYMLHADTVRAEHIQIIINSTKEADNVIPTQERLCGLSLSTLWVGVIKTADNIRI